MFESEEEDDPEIKKKIEAALDATGLMEELMLSEQDDESKSESSDDDGKDDLDKTKRYYEDQAEETGEPEVKTEQSQSCEHRPCCRTGECQKSSHFQARHPIRQHPANQSWSHQGQGSQQ